MKCKLKQIQNEIDIDASPKLVWDVLIEFSQYKDWNPFLVRVEGQAQLGSYLELFMSPPGASPKQKKVLVTSFKPYRELSWKGTKVHTVVLCGQNQFNLLPLSDHQTRLIQEETFSGLLVPLCSTWLDQHLSAGYNKMLIALKSKVEGKVPSSQ